MIFKNLNSEKFNLIYDDMTEQFPPEELKSYTRFCELIDGGDYFVQSVIDGALTIGYVIFTKVNNSLWLDYVAVLKEFHSKGYGSKILNALKDEYQKGIYLEVEKPDESRPNTLRRIKFYTNLGAQKLDYDYFYPSEKAPLPMDLYYLPYDNILPVDIEGDINTVFRLLHSDISYLNS